MKPKKKKKPVKKAAPLKKIWIVLFTHKYGVDVWPIAKKQTPASVIKSLRSRGDWDWRDDERSEIEISGPFEV